MEDSSVPFWKRTSARDLTRQEWESLCDHCGKCCVHRLEDESTGVVHFTNVACRYLDQSTCRCSEYERRADLEAGCFVLSPENLAQNAPWMPTTCAYRLLVEGKELPGWHPLVSGSDATVCRSGQRVCGRVISELETDDALQHHLAEWW